jgi:hypothetical protein
MGIRKNVVIHGSTKNLLNAEQFNVEVDKSWLTQIIISIDGPFRAFWDPIMVLCLLYTGIIMPFKITYIADQPCSWTLLDVLDIIVDVLFIMDLYVSFFSAYEDSSRGITVRDPKKIAINYL